MRRERDFVLVLLGFVHGAVLVLVPIAPIVAVGIWWNSNTVAHNFVHRPFFRSAQLNAGFAAYQSLLLGIPQTLWRERHLAHHADRPWRFRWSSTLCVEIVLIVGSWVAMLTAQPLFFATVYVPGYVAGLALCAMQGHFEHAGAVTTSHYGRLYNLLCFNDGYHGEHHAFPGVHWTELPARRGAVHHVSRWPALLRWIDSCSLDGLERLVLRSPRLQRMVVTSHARAFARVLPAAGTFRQIAIVGGGLFPRTALVLRQLVPDAALVVIDANAHHLETARTYLEARADSGSRSVEFRHETFDARSRAAKFDLVVVPLAFVGRRDDFYQHPPAPLVIVHDWCWRRCGVEGARVSFLLLKRINLVRQ